MFADSGIERKSEEEIKREWNANRRQDRRWLDDLIKRGDELAPTDRERQAFTRISRLSTLEEIYYALEEDDVLRHVKKLYIIVLHERREAIKTLQLRNTKVVKDWWSKEQAWTLGGDLPEQGARDVASGAWNSLPKEDVAVRSDWANSTATIHSQGVEGNPKTPFRAPLLPPDFEDLKGSGVRVAEWDSTIAGGSEYGSEEVEMGEEITEEVIRKFEEGSLAGEEEFHAKVAGWDNGARSGGVEDNGEIWCEEEDTEAAEGQSTGWRSPKPGDRVFRERETAQVNEGFKTPEHQMISDDF